LLTAGFVFLNEYKNYGPVKLRDRFEFESDYSDSIPNIRISGTCSHITNHAHCSQKNFNCCTVVIQIYFMFMIFMFRPM